MIPSDLGHSGNYPNEKDAKEVPNPQDFAQKFHRLSPLFQANALAIVAKKKENSQKDHLQLYKKAIYGEEGGEEDFETLCTLLKAPFYTTKLDEIFKLRQPESRKLALVKMLIEHPAELINALKKHSLTQVEQQFLLQEAVSIADASTIRDLLEIFPDIDPPFLSAFEQSIAKRSVLLVLQLAAPLKLQEEKVREYLKWGISNDFENVILFAGEDAEKGRFDHFLFIFKALDEKEDEPNQYRFLKALEKFEGQKEFQDCLLAKISKDPEQIKEILTLLEIKDLELRKRLLMHAVSSRPRLIEEIDRKHVQELDVLETLFYAVKQGKNGETLFFLGNSLERSFGRRGFDEHPFSLIIDLPYPTSPPFTKEEGFFYDLFKFVSDQEILFFKEDFFRFVICALHLGLDEKHLSIHRDLIHELLSLKDYKLRKNLLFNAVLSLKEREQPFSTLLESVSHTMFTSCQFTKEQARAMQSFLNNQKKPLKNSLLMEVTLKTLDRFTKLEGIRPDQAVAVFQRAFAKSSLESWKNLLLLHLIPDKDVKTLAEDKTFEEVFLLYFETTYPEFQGIDQKTVSEKILSMRDPTALFRYYENIQQEKRKNPSNYQSEIAQMEEAFKRLFFAILDGTLPKLREENEHLSTLQEKNPDFPLALWFQEQVETHSLTLSQTERDVFVRRIQDAIKSGLPDLLEEVENKTLDSLKKERESLIQEGKKDDLLLINQKIYIKEALEATFNGYSTNDLKEYCNRAKSLRINLGDLLEISSELKDALKKEQTLVVSCTDKVEDLLLSGEEPLITCQAVSASIDTNRGLLGLLLNGQTRLLTIKKQGKKTMEARVIVRLLVDKNDKPALLVETVYAKEQNTQAQKLLFSFASKIAKGLNIPVYVGSQRSFRSEILYSHGGLADEYYDSLRDLSSEGSTPENINKASIHCALYSPE